jgi:hypothetical protein
MVFVMTRKHTGRKDNGEQQDPRVAPSDLQDISEARRKHSEKGTAKRARTINQSGDADGGWKVEE